MEKITIKINIDSLNSILNWVDDVYFNDWSREDRVVNSIMFDLTSKLKKKAIDKKHIKKPFKISLKYHEAFALMEVCRTLETMIWEDDVFAKNAVLKTANEIDKQL